MFFENNSEKAWVLRRKGVENMIWLRKCILNSAKHKPEECLAEMSLFNAVRG